MGHSVATLDQHHDVSGFDCGEPALNTWLRTIAHQHQNKNLSKTFVLVDDEAPQTIIGFYALALRGLMPREALPPAMAKKLPSNVPGYTLARLAVGAPFQGAGYGETLLMDAIFRARSVASQAGGPFLFVDAKDSRAANFYANYGFAPFPADPLTLVLRL
jgi:GNAT superfamily N-acetyltransferase